MLPSTWVQVLVIAVVVVPGFVYEISLRAARGPSADESQFGVRVLRAIVASIIFVSVYNIAIGPLLVQILRRPAMISEEPRAAAMLALALIALIPFGAARVQYLVASALLYQKVRSSLLRWLRLRRNYDPTPTAWDYTFAGRKPGFVRILTSDGTWVGGYFAGESFASSFPGPREIYLENSYQMSSDGAFTGIISALGGAYIRCDDIRMIEFPTGDPSEGVQVSSSSWSGRFRGGILAIKRVVSRSVR